MLKYGIIAGYKVPRHQSMLSGIKNDILAEALNQSLSNHL